MPTRTVQIASCFRDLETPSRYKVYYGGRGGGKSWAFAQSLLLRGGREPTRILCCREVQNSIQDSVHKLLSDLIYDLGMGDFYKITQTSIRGVNGTEFFFKGLRHNAHEIKSTEGVDIAWVEEADKVTDASWDLLIPTIRNPGSEIWVSFNPGLKTDATYRRFIRQAPDNAIVRKVGWRDNPWFSDELRAEMDHLKGTDYENYLHVWEGELQSFADGAVYATQIKQARKEGRICHIPIESAVPVHTFWDLGNNDHTAIWFMQHVGPVFRFIDYYQNRGEEPAHYARVLRDKGYLYGTHYMPHDAGHSRMGVGQLGHMFEDLGVKPIRIVPRIGDVNIGINQTRQMWPHVMIDENRCEEGMDCLIEYQYRYDDLRGTHMRQPLHNWASNGADAFRQCAQGYDGRSWEEEHISERRKARVNKRLNAEADWIV